MRSRWPNRREHPDGWVRGQLHRQGDRVLLFDEPVTSLHCTNCEHAIHEVPVRLAPPRCPECGQIMGDMPNPGEGQ